MTTPTLSLVIPAYNEAESLPILLKEIREVCQKEKIEYEVIIIDDGSRDGTFEVVKNQSAANRSIQGLRFRRNCGKAAALSVGFQVSRGDYVITLDADLQDNPIEIPSLLEMLKGDFDMVSGWKKKRHDPLEKRIPSKIFNGVISKVAGLKLHDFNCGLKAYRRDVVKSLTLYGELHRYIPVMAHWNGFRVGEKVVEHRARQFGKSKYGLERYAKGLFDMVTLVFLHRYAYRPLHVFGLLGLICCLGGSAILCFFLIQYFLTFQLHVRPLMLGGVAAIIVGIQFVSMGLLGEMINQRSSDFRYPVSDSTTGLPFNLST